MEWKLKLWCHWTICADCSEFAMSAQLVWYQISLVMAESDLKSGLKVDVMTQTSGQSPSPPPLALEYDLTIRREAFSSCRQCFLHMPPCSLGPLFSSALYSTLLHSISPLLCLPLFASHPTPFTGFGGATCLLLSLFPDSSCLSFLFL